MATWRRDGRLTGGQRLLCAGVAGALSLSLTAPLELATVLAQVGARRGRARGPWAEGLRVWRAEGPRALWKGNAVACLRLFPCSAVQLAAYRKFVMLFTDDLGHISQWRSIMAGSLAGMVSTVVTYPTDLIKTRLTVQNLLEPSYRGIFHAFSTVYQQEGFLALYRGVSLTVLGALPFSAGSLLVYMNLERIWNGPRDRFSLLQNFANVCLAAAVTQTLSFPFDTVKRNMQRTQAEVEPLGLACCLYPLCHRIAQRSYIRSCKIKCQQQLGSNMEEKKKKKPTQGNPDNRHSPTKDGLQRLSEPSQSFWLAKHFGELTGSALAKT
ncbi:solute carrier family 25 member 43 isoform X2 [Leopardus geoffroyi]|uniref:solute carrier family 25 member 43 isoform X2 n=1 Tax=Leopardus geoffroyi TaxID=46844 RepID=UPI001E25EFFE|nr:solute carrier family 25 member 43 isoform X2 [Leopardus geoffroyi]